MPPDAPTQAPPRRRELAVWLIGLSVVAAALVITVIVMGGRIEAATWGLVVAAGSMVFALHSLYRMATVLSRPAVEVVLEQDDVAALAGVRQLREEKRRVLRAINELQFDYEMGKLSDEDYQQVRQGYQLRAVEVMRALDERPTLHPELEKLLEDRGLMNDDASAEGTSEAEAEAAPEDGADADETPSSETAAEGSDGEVPGDEASADEPPKDETSADEASADEASADETSADEASADEASADEASANEPQEDAADAEDDEDDEDRASSEAEEQDA